MPFLSVPRALLLPPLLVLIGGCSVHDAYVAGEAQTRLVGLSEVELESCLGVPDQHASFGSTDVLTYYATSSSSVSYSIPIVGGLGFSNGGYCHATVRADAGRVTRVSYSGEKNATGAPDAYCAPIVRTCMAYLAAHPETMRVAPTAAAAAGSTTPNAGVPNGTPSGTPQPGSSVAAYPSNVPTPTPR